MKGTRSSLVTETVNTCGVVPWGGSTRSRDDGKVAVLNSICKFRRASELVTISCCGAGFVPCGAMKTKDDGATRMRGSPTGGGGDTESVTGTAIAPPPPLAQAMRIVAEPPTESPVGFARTLSCAGVTPNAVPRSRKGESSCAVKLTPGWKLVNEIVCGGSSVSPKLAKKLRLCGTTPSTHDCAGATTSKGAEALPHGLLTTTGALPGWSWGTRVSMRLGGVTVNEVAVPAKVT